MNAHQEILARQNWKPQSASKLTMSRRNLRLILYVELLALDIFALVVGPWIGSMLLSSPGRAREEMFVAAALVPLYGILAVSRGAYSRRSLERASESVRRSIVAFGLAVFMVIVVAFFLKSGAEISRVAFSAGICGTFIAMVAGRILVTRQAFKLTRGHLLTELLLLDGVPLEQMPCKEATVVSASAINLRPDLNDPMMLSFFGNLVTSFDRVIVHSRVENHRSWSLLLKGANVNGEIVMHSANDIGAIAINGWGDHDTLVVARQALSLPNRLKKRLLDLAISLPLVVFLSPILALIAIVIKLDTAGPVFFKQDRVGRGNRLFKVLKFRSMRTDSCDAAGNRSASRDDARITRVGRFIRATSIDELPQLINVVCGDMSLVGPRPHALGSLAGNQLFWQVDQTYWLRHQLKPGITGLAQVRGYRGATAEATDLTDRLQSDMEYIEGWDIWRDLSILANTFRVIVHRNAF